MSRGESFLGRWARRKEESRRDEPAAADPLTSPPPAEVVAPDAVPGEAPQEAAEAPAEEEAPLDLPDVDSLDADSDYSAFMDSRVPEETQRRALRRLWSSDPAYAFRDGLNEYDEDYTAPRLLGAAVKTVYDVVRGYAPAEDVEGETESQPGDAADSAVAKGTDEVPHESKEGGGAMQKAQSSGDFSP